MEIKEIALLLIKKDNESMSQSVKDYLKIDNDLEQKRSYLESLKNRRSENRYYNMPFDQELQLAIYIMAGLVEKKDYSLDIKEVCIDILQEKISNYEYWIKRGTAPSKNWAKENEKYIKILQNIKQSENLSDVKKVEL